ncbi:MAG: DUF4157 domain-containing protein, partial [Saprospiraceae bacterium]
DAPIVMRMPLTTVSGIQRSCAGCEEEQQAQRKETNGGDASGKAAPSIVSDVLSSGGGQAMDGGTRQFMESRFGQDFSSVRIHTGSRAAESAGAIQAKAYTSGRDVVFGAGEYQPGSESGRRLLAHELVHVGQQGGGVQRMVIPRNVTCHQTGLRNPDLTGPEVVEQIDFADAIAISMLQSAEDDLAAQLNNVGGGGVPDVAINQILTEELDLDLNTPAHLPLIQQVVGRINRVRTTMESGYLRYMCRGGSNVSLVGCASAACEEGDFAFTCPGNRLIVLCQGFWDNVAERPGTILHEVFHIWFDMDHGNRTKRANATCLEGFVRRINGLGAGDFSCAGGVP